MTQRGAAGRHIQSQVDPLEKRQLFASHLGINVNNFGGDDYGAIVKMLHDSGTTDVRLWYGFNNYQERSLANVAKYVKKFAHDGFSVTLSVNPRKGRHGTVAETRGFFEWLGTQDGMTQAVDYWEIGNEPDSQNYWKGTLSEYVSDYLAPAARVLHNLGEKVVSGGVAWNPDDIKTLVNAGMLKSVDYVGYHPYRPSTANLKKSIAAVESYVGGKPLFATEWNIRGREKDKKSWAAGVQDFWEVIRQHFAVAHYFAAVVQDSPAGPAGVLTESGKPNRPFYNVYLGLQNAGTDNNNGGGDDDGGDDDDNNSGNNGGGSGDDDNNDDNHGDDDNNGTDSDGDNSGGNTTGGSQGGGSDGDSDGSSGSGSDGDSDGSGGNGTGSSSGGSSGGGSSSGGSSGGGSSSGGGTVKDPVTPPVVAPPPPPAISALSLIDASRDRIIKPYAVLSGASTVDLASTGTSFLSFLASANSRTGSVRFTIGGNSIIDNDGNFTLYGEANGNIGGVDLLANHMYVLSMQAFAGLNATGKASEVLTYVINVINTSDPLNTVSPAQAQAQARQKAKQIARRKLFTPVDTIPGL